MGLLRFWRHFWPGRRAAWVFTLTLRITTFALLATAAPAPADEAIVPIERSAQPEILTLRGEVFHVQGLDIDAQFIYVTSADTRGRRALLHKFNRAGDLVGVVDITDGSRTHPGGFSIEGDSIWIPVAEYRPGSTSRIVEIDKATLTIRSSFLVNDHIGAVAAGGGRIHGGNWDSEMLYAWDARGHQLTRVRNPGRVAYQDLKWVDGVLVASGLQRGGFAGAVDWLDPDTLQFRGHLPVGRMENGGVWAQEGMALAGDSLYFLPDDGRDGVARVYVFDLARLSGTAMLSH